MEVNIRTVMATWIIAGGVWAAGVIGLSATGICGETGVVTDAGQTQGIYTHTGAWTPYQPPSGKYTVTVRSQRLL